MFHNIQAKPPLEQFQAVLQSGQDLWLTMSLTDGWWVGGNSHRN